MYALEIIKPGPHSLIQDLGRFGVAQLGLSQGGALDLHAFCWGNRLLDNDSHCASIEIALGHATFKALSNVRIAITGADMSVTIDQHHIANWQAVTLYKGQILKFHGCSQGMRSYLSIEGGFVCQQVFGSSSTVVRNKLGGLNQVDEDYGLGLALRAEDKLACHAQNKSRLGSARRTLAREYIPSFPNPLSIRVIESYQHKHFSQAQKLKFYSHHYELSTQSDRMGLRLSGPAIDADIEEIISEGIALGSIQIPNDGQPIILMNDRQTLGGYPKIGCVAKIDLSKLAQARPGTKIKFKAVSCEELSQAWLEFLQFFNL